MKGSPTPVDVVEKFRADYIYSGNAAASARKFNISESTGQQLAREASKDPEFAALRRALRVQWFEECAARRMAMAQKAHERFDADYEPGPGEIDARPAYGKLVIDAEKNAHALAKLEGESNDKREPTEVHIHLVGDDESSG